MPINTVKLLNTPIGVSEEETKELVETVSRIPQDVKFPFDAAGASIALRKVGMQAAQKVRGDRAKFEVLIATLDILRAHAYARFAGDATDREVSGMRAEIDKTTEWATQPSAQKGPEDVPAPKRRRKAKAKAADTE